MCYLRHNFCFVLFCLVFLFSWNGYKISVVWILAGPNGEKEFDAVHWRDQQVQAQSSYLSFCIFMYILIPRWEMILNRGHATLHLAVSVGPSVIFSIACRVCITTPAQPSMTVLPCIRPCRYVNVTRPSRPIRCDVWIVERMRYQPTNRPTDGHSQL